MAPLTNGRLLFNSVPTGYPEPGKTTVYDTTEIIDIQTIVLNGGILIKVLEISIDPYLRSRMRARSYYDSFTLGESISSYGVGVVIRSEFSGVKAGDHVYGNIPFQNYFIDKNMDRLKIIENPHNFPWSTFLSVFGIPGQTAYMAWKEYSKAKKGEIAYVSSGAGAVGSFVIQFAKLDGLKVIASAGSDEKVKVMKELGADVAFNYKTTSVNEILAKEGPIDVYWDNVGGETLEAALVNASQRARFIECGMISGYNNGGQPIKRLGEIIIRSITMHGFIMFILIPKYEAEFITEMTAKVLSGEIKYRHIVYDGLASSGEAILAVLRGSELNIGKAVLHVADE